MRTHGTLTKWNDEKGFGFVLVPSSHEQIFVHISAFPKDGVRPRIGELISFEVRTAPDGRKRAEAVERGGSSKAPRKQHARKRVQRAGLLGSLLAGCVVFALGFLGYETYVARRATNAGQPVSRTEPAIEGAFTCDGRTHCSQMTSCAEARYFLKHCPGAQMDGNGDGEPCEQQWCN